MTKTFHLIFGLLCAVNFAIAQKGNSPPATTYKLIFLKAMGSTRYTEKEILPASGLVIGQNVAEPDFREAARRLGDTGLFTDVAYSFSYSNAGTKVEFQLTDIDKDKLVPAHFENFVWFTDAELLHEVQKRVPLFNQELPEAGTLSDRIEEALQGILDDQQIPGRVVYFPQSTTAEGKVTGFAYQVDALDISIQETEFPGAPPGELPPLKAAARKLIGAPYMRSSLAIIAKDDFLPVFLQHGYLKAAFAPTDAHVTKQENGEVAVDAIFGVTPGKIYSTSVVQWNGNSALKTDELQGMIHLPAGEPANAIRLAKDLEEVTKIYHTHGYMLARITPQPALDEDKSTVRYDIHVVEGDQFKMGEFEVLGLDSGARARLQAAWKLAEGQPYNGEYAKQFVEDSRRLIPPGVPWDIKIHEAVNEKDKTVDVTIRFGAR